MRIVALWQKRHHTGTLLRGPEERHREKLRLRPEETLEDNHQNDTELRTKSVDFILPIVIIIQNYKKKDTSSTDTLGYDIIKTCSFLMKYYSSVEDKRHQLD